MTKRNKKGRLPNWSVLSVLVIVGAEWLIFTTTSITLTISAFLIATLPAGIVAALGFNVLVSTIVVGIVSLIEILNGRKIMEAITYGITAGVVVVIPTPIAGTLVGGIKGLEYLGKVI